MLIETGSRIGPEDLICFVHIPKTGGVTLDRALAPLVGTGGRLLLVPQSFDALESGPARLHLALRRWLLRQRQLFGAEIRRLTGRPCASPRNVRLIHGHIGLDAMPHPRRPRRVLTLVREPLDRLISLYYYNREKALRATEAGRKPRAALKRSVLAECFEEHAEALLAEGSGWHASQQCRYLSRSGTAEDAIRAVDQELFLAAPTERMPDFLDRLGDAAGVPLDSGLCEHRSRLRPPRVDLPPRLRDRLNARLDDDRRLYAHVRAAFARLDR